METQFQSYYTKNAYIKDYMIDMLNLHDKDLILEPCGGDGAFIDGLLARNSNLRIDTCDLNQEAAEGLAEKYKTHKNIQVRQVDTLTDKTFDLYAKQGYYDKIIGNPPYGAKQDLRRRKSLKTKYDGFYVKETYSLFLFRCLSLLKADGLLSFIIPDTFLFLHNHKGLRDYLLKHTQIKEILIFPSKFFPGVSFGYSNLCIITLKKVESEEEALDHEFCVIKGFENTEDIARYHAEKMSDELKLRRLSITEGVSNKANLTKYNLKQSKVYDNNSHSFILTDQVITSAFENCPHHLSDFASCVTGIYTGNNKKFIYAASEQVKGSKGYPIADRNKVMRNWNSLDGLTSGFRYVPLVKGSSSTPYIRRENQWYIDWRPAAIRHYLTDKKARFQNSDYYFKMGIALPMIKNKKIYATAMTGKVFDQSIVGIFPKEKRYFYYLLGLLNSDIFNDILHAINPTANNSANYLKKCPVPRPDMKSLMAIASLVKIMLENPFDEKTQQTLNQIYEDLYKNEK